MKIEFKNADFVYGFKTPFAHPVIENFSWKVEEGKTSVIIGKTGCGKSTIVKHINGLILPTGGHVLVGEFKFSRKKVKILKGEKYKKTRKVKDLRRRIGYVSQIPEYQLFEDTIYKDLIFGPKNFGMNKENFLENAKKCLKMVGMSEDYLERSPLDLSGGQKRRVALAGVLMMSPEVMIFDEPTAGLDPEGERDIVSIIRNLSKDPKKTIIIISHDMNLTMAIADIVILLDDGKIIRDESPREIFGEKLDEDLHVVSPDIVRIERKLFGKEENISVTIEELVEKLSRRIKSAK